MGNGQVSYRWVAQTSCLQSGRLRYVFPPISEALRFALKVKSGSLCLFEQNELSRRNKLSRWQALEIQSAGKATGVPLLLISSRRKLPGHQSCDFFAFRPGILSLARNRLGFLLPLEHNAHEPQPKRLTRENRAKREGSDWKNLFSFLIVVCSVFSVLKIFAFFAHILLVRDYARFSAS